jgi:hypothetical protein
MAVHAARRHNKPAWKRLAQGATGQRLCVIAYVFSAFLHCTMTIALLESSHYQAWARHGRSL